MKIQRIVDVIAYLLWLASIVLYSKYMSTIRPSTVYDLTNSSCY